LRFVYRWIANGLAFFFGLYLVDTLIAPYFYLRKLWLAIVIAVLMSAINSTNRPFRGYKANRGRALGFFGLTALGNYLFMAIVSWAGAPLTGNAMAFMFAAVFLTLLAALLNHLVGFKPKEQPKVVTREHGMSDATRESLAAIEARRRERRKQSRRLR
jgi:uncharacterized membrane protein YvlD (DUF360 family)